MAERPLRRGRVRVAAGGVARRRRNGRGSISAWGVGADAPVARGGGAWRCAHGLGAWRLDVHAAAEWPSREELEERRSGEVELRSRVGRHVCGESVAAGHEHVWCGEGAQDQNSPPAGETDRAQRGRALRLRGTSG